MTRGSDPLADATALIPRVYAYVAYRLGDGAEAEDVVSATFERAVRYRRSYDPKRGTPVAWLIGIAKHCINDAVAARSRTVTLDELPEPPADLDVEQETVRRLVLGAAIAHLGERDQELLALRFGAGMRTREIADLVGAKTNAVDVAIHRALARLRHELERDEAPELQLDTVSDAR